MSYEIEEGPRFMDKLGKTLSFREMKRFVGKTVILRALQSCEKVKSIGRPCSLQLFKSAK